MTLLDDVVNNLARDIDTLTPRSQAALFWSCASALRDHYVEWHEETEQGKPEILDASLAAAHTALLEEVTPAGDVLSKLEAYAPPGEAIGNIASDYAQSCWICVDVAVRILTDSEYVAGSAIEYALTPRITEVTERLFGVSQVGSGPDEGPQTEALLADPDIRAAIEFCRWAISALEGHHLLTAQRLETLRQKATVLSPA